MKTQFAELCQTYNSVSFTVATATTDKNIKADIAGSFQKLAQCRAMRLTTDQQITIKLNSVDNPGIIITSSESPFVISEYVMSVGITNIFISNASGSTANIKLLLTA